MKLTKYYQSADGSNIEIDVEYDPQENEVTETYGAWATDGKRRIDITHILSEFFNLDKIIDETNWRAIYAEQRPDAIRWI